MDVLEAIRNRRTIRMFRPELVSEDLIRTMIEAAIWAPNAWNEQPWEFIVIRKSETVKKIRELFQAFVKVSHLKLPKDHPHRILREQRLHDSVYKDYYAGCAAFLAVFVNPEKTEHPLEDASAAIENMMLAAWNLGLGTAWLETLPEKEVKKLLGVPERLKFIACIPIGYPARIPPPPPRKPLEAFIHFEKYGRR